MWARKDLGAWMIPKGLIEPGEDAGRGRGPGIRGGNRPQVSGRWLAPLTPLRQAGGKTVLCWVAEADLDLAAFKPGLFEMEWPPRSGKRARFPEVDRLELFRRG